jgi:hypothetical protein
MTMTRIVIVLLALTLFKSGSLAQTAGPSSIVIPAGTIISAELSEAIDAKKVKVGDKIEAKTVVAVRVNGSLSIPKGSKILGHITAAKPLSGDSKDSTVGIVFDTVSMKDGGDVIFLAFIQAIGAVTAPPNFSTRAGFPLAGAIGPPRSGAWGQASDDLGTPLGPSSHGVIGLKGLSLSRSGAGSVVTSDSENVHLESRTQLILAAEESL